MRGSAPLQNEQKGSSEFSACIPASPELCAAAGDSYTRSISQSEQRVKPRRYSTLNWGQNILVGPKVYYNDRISKSLVSLSLVRPALACVFLARWPVYQLE